MHTPRPIATLRPAYRPPAILRQGPRFSFRTILRAAPELLGALALAAALFGAGLAAGYATRGWLERVEEHAR